MSTLITDLPPRRLDALFAEKVLGLDPRVNLSCAHCRGTGKALSNQAWGHLVWFGPGDPPPVVHVAPGEPCGGCKGTGIDTDDKDDRLESYTTSLDAAWAGVEKLRPATVEFDLEYGTCSLSGVTGGMGLGASPALALVLACLRAVGVEEVPE